MKRPLAMRVTLLLLALEALLPLAIAGLIAFVLAGDVVSGRRSFGFVVTAAAISAWPFLTAMGLVSYRRWSLFSILGLATVQSLCSAFGLSSDLSKSDSRGHSPLEFVYLSLLALGVWWLVYFTRPATRVLFAPKP